MKSPKFSDYWVAEISFFQGNPVSRYVIFINHVSEDEVLFTPFILGEHVEYSSKEVNSFALKEKINMKIGG